mgnify:CR=1 FL=1
MQPLQPPGSTPASAWDPVAFVERDLPPVCLAPALDWSTGERVSIFRGEDPVLAAIGIQFGTEEGSGISVTEDGHRFFEIRKATSDAPARVRGEILRLLQPFIDDGSIKLLERVGEISGSRGLVRVKFQIVRTGQEVEISR